MSTSTKPIDPKTKERYAELIGFGLSHRRRLGAPGISERSGERLMAKPQYRKIAEEAKRGRGMQGLAATAVYELLTAEHEDGRPNLVLRQKGLDAYVRNPALIEGEEEAEALLPDGVMLVYPVPPSAREPVSETERLFGFADIGTASAEPDTSPTEPDVREAGTRRSSRA
jgi:hypothetical protein